MIPGGGDPDQSGSEQPDGTTEGPEPHDDDVEADGRGEEQGSATPSHQPIWPVKPQRGDTSSLGTHAERLYSDEIRLKARAEWELGLKNPTQIARELGIKGRTTLYSWATSDQWLPRGSTQAAIRDTIDSQVISSAAAEMRARAADPQTEADVKLREQMDLLGLDSAELAPDGQQIVREYSLAVTEVLRAHQTQAETACDIGGNLIAMYHAATTQLRGHFERTPGAKRDGILKRMEMIAKTGSQFAVLVRALAIAHQMQRDAFQVSKGATPAPNPGKGAMPPDEQPPAPGSYEEVLLEAERRGALNS